jgi:hypothetical protein
MDSVESDTWRVNLSEEALSHINSIEAKQKALQEASENDQHKVLQRIPKSGHGGMSSGRIMCCVLTSPCFGLQSSSRLRKKGFGKWRQISRRLEGYVCTFANSFQ